MAPTIASKSFVESAFGVFGLNSCVFVCVFATNAMASNSTDNILCELAKLVGVEAICVRKTDESPPRVSVIDVAVVVTGHDAHYASDAVRNIRKKFPDIHDLPGRILRV